MELFLYQQPKSCADLLSSQLNKFSSVPLSTKCNWALIYAFPRLMLSLSSLKPHITPTSLFWPTSHQDFWGLMQVSSWKSGLSISLSPCNNNLMASVAVLKSLLKKVHSKVTRAKTLNKTDFLIFWINSSHPQPTHHCPLSCWYKPTSLWLKKLANCVSARRWETTWKDFSTFKFKSVEIALRTEGQNAAFNSTGGGRIKLKVRLDVKVWGRRLLAQRGT